MKGCLAHRVFNILCPGSARPSLLSHDQTAIKNAQRTLSSTDIFAVYFRMAFVRPSRSRCHNEPKRMTLNDKFVNTIAARQRQYSNSAESDGRHRRQSNPSWNSLSGWYICKYLSSATEADRDFVFARMAWVFDKRDMILRNLILTAWLSTIRWKPVGSWKISEVSSDENG